MRKNSVLQRLEFFTLVFLLISFVWLFSLKIEKKPMVPNPNEWFVDLNSTTNYDGKLPEPPNPNPNNNGPWSRMDNIVWGNLVLGANTIYVFADVNGGSDQLTNAISPTHNNVTLLGVKDTNDSAYWPAAIYNPAPSYPILGADPNYDINIVDLTSSGTGTIFRNFIFNGDDDEIAVNINQSNGSQFENCEIYSNGDDNTSSGMVIYSNVSDNVSFEECTLVATEDITNNILFFNQCDNLNLTECTTVTSLVTSKSCFSIILLNGCNNCNCFRNIFHIDTNEGCSYGVKIAESDDFNFTSNSVYGTCSEAAFYDYPDNRGGMLLCNTIYNKFSSQSSSDHGFGYYSERNSSENLSSFQNNILYATSYNPNGNQGYAIYIYSDFDYWQPPSGDFRKNCYYGIVNTNYVAHCSLGNYYSDVSWNNDTHDMILFLMIPNF